MKESKYNIFTQVIVSKTIKKGLLAILQNSGLGGLQPNTIIMGWPTQWRTNQKGNTFVKVVGASNKFGHCITVLKPASGFEERTKRLKGFIDIWSVVYDGGILLLIAYLLKKSKFWKKCTIRLFSLTPLKEIDTNPHMKLKYINLIRTFLERFRILENIEIEMVVMEPQKLEQHTYKMEKNLQNKGSMLESIQSGMGMTKKESMKALMNTFQQKEIELAMEIRRKREEHKKLVKLKTQEDLIHLIPETELNEVLEQAEAINKE